MTLCVAGTVPTPLSPVEVAEHAQRLLAAAYSRTGPGACLVVARGDQVLFQGASGLADIERGVPMDCDGVLRLGSLGKHMVAVGLLTLADAGRLSLDDALSRFLPDYPNGDRIKLWQLLNHTSGVFDFIRLRCPWRRRRRTLTTRGLIELFQTRPVTFEPGQGCAYNNSGYVLAGAVIEAVTGRHWYEYLEHALFQPLGMTRTGYADDPRLLPLQARGYRGLDGRPTLVRHRSMTQVHAAGGLASSTNDLMRWNFALHGGHLLSTDSYRLLVTPRGAAAAHGHGLGLMRTTLRGVDAIEHGGIIRGYQSQFIHLPSAGLTVLGMANTGGQRRPVCQTMARRLAAIALGDPHPEPVAPALPPAQLSALQGVYRSVHAEVDIRLRVIDGQLTAQGKRRPNVLLPIAEDAFVYANSVSVLRIVHDGTGAVAGVRFFRNGEGSGELALRVPPTASPWLDWLRHKRHLVPGL